MNKEAQILLAGSHVYPVLSAFQLRWRTDSGAAGSGLSHQKKTAACVHMNEFTRKAPLLSCQSLLGIHHEHGFFSAATHAQQRFQPTSLHRKWRRVWAAGCNF